MSTRALVDLGDGRHMVPLTQGRVAIIDSSDASEIGQWNWHAYKKGRTWYAARNVVVDKRRTKVEMHRQLAGVQGLEVDHRNGDGLDNRRTNLRCATSSQNKHNSRVPRNNTSGAKGVSWKQDRQRWRAQIAAHGRKFFLGYYTSFHEAFTAYAAAAEKMHGPFSRVA